MVAAVLCRGEAQTLRLSMLFALAAQRAEITAEDLAAAVDLWRYCRASAESIFAGVHDALFHKIEAAIRAEPGITRTAIYRRLGKGNGSAVLVDALARVRAAGVARSEKAPTNGRPVEKWYPVDVEHDPKKVTKPKKPPQGVEASDPSCAFYPSCDSAPGEVDAPPAVWNPDNLKPGVYTL